MTPFVRSFALPLVLALFLAACGSSDEAEPAGAEASDTEPRVDPRDWDAVLAEAEGQSVRWWMFGETRRPTPTWTSTWLSRPPTSA